MNEAVTRLNRLNLSPSADRAGDAPPNARMRLNRLNPSRFASPIRLPGAGWGPVSGCVVTGHRPTPGRRETKASALINRLNLSPAFRGTGALPNARARLNRLNLSLGKEA